MYIEIPDALSGTIQLEEVINNSKSNLMVGLREMTFTADWYNVSRELGNHYIFIRISQQERNIQIPDGYYNLELLEKRISQEIKGFKLEHDLTTNLIQLTLPSATGVFYNFAKLSDLLGCESTWLPGGTHLCEKPHKLYTHKAIYVYLDQINTSNNILVKNKIGKRSNLLRRISTNDIQFGESTTITFERPQYRRLCDGTINELALSVLDVDGHKINMNSSFITLDIQDEKTLEYRAE